MTEFAPPFFVQNASLMGLPRYWVIDRRSYVNIATHDTLAAAEADRNARNVQAYADSLIPTPVFVAPKLPDINFAPQFQQLLTELADYYRYALDISPDEIVRQARAKLRYCIESDFSYACDQVFGGEN